MEYETLGAFATLVPAFPLDSRVRRAPRTLKR